MIFSTCFKVEALKLSMEIFSTSQEFVVATSSESAEAIDLLIGIEPSEPFVGIASRQSAMAGNFVSMTSWS